MGHNRAAAKHKSKRSRQRSEELVPKVKFLPKSPSTNATEAEKNDYNHLVRNYYLGLETAEDPCLPQQPAPNSSNVVMRRYSHAVEVYHKRLKQDRERRLAVEVFRNRPLMKPFRPINPTVGGKGMVRYKNDVEHYAREMQKRGYMTAAEGKATLHELLGVITPYRCRLEAHIRKETVELGRMSGKVGRRKLQEIA